VTPWPNRRVAGALALAAAAVAPAIANDYQTYIINLAFIFGLLALGLNVLLGYAGQLAFSNIALFGIGAYATALLRVDVGLPFAAALPLSVVVAIVVGLLAALPAFRLRGLYLALATLAFAEFAHWTFSHWDAVTRGMAGIVVPRPSFAAMGLSAAAGTYYCSLAALVAAVLVLARILRSQVGRRFVAIRENEIAARSVGVNVARTKALAFGISAGLAGLAGSLFAMLLGLVTPESFATYHMIFQFAMVVVGGLGSVAGALLGVGMLVWTVEALRVFRELQEIIYGAALLLAVLLLPNGIAGLLRTRVGGWSEPLRRPDRIT
jgi:branched-chain amino acid transport system permease protein